MLILVRFWQWMAVPTITIPIPRLEASTMLPTRLLMQMEHHRDVQLVRPSNPLYMLRLLRWAGIQVQLFLIYEHTFLTVHRPEHRSTILLSIILPTIA